MPTLKNTTFLTYSDFIFPVYQSENCKKVNYKKLYNIWILHWNRMLPRKLRSTQNVAHYRRCIINTNTRKLRCLRTAHNLSHCSHQHAELLLLLYKRYCSTFESWASHVSQKRPLSCVCWRRSADRGYLANASENKTSIAGNIVFGRETRCGAINKLVQTVKLAGTWSLKIMCFSLHYDNSRNNNSIHHNSKKKNKAL